MTKLYSLRYREIEKVFETQQYASQPNKDLPNIFFFLYQRSHIDTAMRCLLDRCFLDTTHKNIKDMPNGEQIAANIIQRAQGRPNFP